MYREIGKKLNMSFDDFINRPKYEIEMMMKVISDVDAKKNKVSENMLQSLENSKLPKNVE